VAVVDARRQRQALLPRCTAADVAEVDVRHLHAALLSCFCTPTQVVAVVGARHRQR